VSTTLPSSPIPEPSTPSATLSRASWAAYQSCSPIVAVAEVGSVLSHFMCSPRTPDSVVDLETVGSGTFIRIRNFHHQIQKVIVGTSGQSLKVMFIL